MSQYERVVDIVKELKKGLKSNDLDENQLGHRLNEILLELESQDVKEDSLMVFVQKILKNQSDIIGRIEKIERSIKSNRDLIDEVNERADKYSELLLSLFKKQNK